MWVVVQGTGFDDDEVLDAALGPLGGALGEGRRGLVIGEPGAQYFFDLVGRPAQLGAVSGEHVEFVTHGAAGVGDIEQVVGVGVAGNQAQGRCWPMPPIRVGRCGRRSGGDC
jgi:hypothetical protein